ncbi:MATE family efflux transporter [Marinigracilibium pacificum]|uniref:Multidrug-efflux transporter n=1 Tax=Marinigracilibium pacificum TaxID=2729599 RepID=A0A848IWT9_9BACT|nr:MATE family efflux transporter [Marinigracilibium pacificum]NMM48787.1 MATE family efflux transporter [Marinigracilibium pacificum]
MNYIDHFKTNLKLAVPVMISQLGHIMVNVADSAMVGHLGKTPLAGAALANSIFSLALTFGIGLSIGVTPYVAAADGEKNFKKMGSFLYNGMLVGIASGLILCLLIFAVFPLLPYFNQPPEVVEVAKPYLAIIGFSLIPLMLFQILRQFVEGLTFTREAMVIILAANLINIILNYIFIFGKLGLPPMGLVGAGYSTLISRVLMMIALWYFVAKNKRFVIHRRFTLKARFKKETIKNILSVGIPGGIQYTFEVGAFAMAVIMMGWMGKVEQAAHQVAISLASISYMMASGLSAAATIRVGNQLGKKDFSTLKKATHTLFAMGLLFMGVCALLFTLGSHWLPTLFIDDAEVVALASQLIIIAAIFQLSDGLQVVCLGALRGLTDVKVPTFITLLAYWVFGLPVSWFLGFKLDYGAQGIWYGLLIGLTIAGVLSLIRFEWYTNRMIRRYKGEV